jgi:recombination protein RecT
MSDQSNTNGNGAAVAQREPSAIAVFRDQFKRMEAEVLSALPKHVPVERFMRVVLTAVNENPDLLYADRRSLLASSLKAAQDGLLPDGRDGALVVYKTKTKQDGKDIWIAKVQWMPMLGGLLKRVRNSGEIKSIEAHVVRQGDRFTYVLGDSPRLEHEPNLDREDGELRFAYAVAWLKDGSVVREVMTRSQIAQVRSVSKAGDAGPWVKWESEMWRKSVFRRLFKWLPKSSDLDDLVREDDDLYEFGDKNERAAVKAAQVGMFQPVRSPLSDEPEPEPPAATFGVTRGFAVEADGRVDPETGEVEEIRQDGGREPADAFKSAPPKDTGKKEKPTSEPASGVDEPSDDTFEGEVVVTRDALFAAETAGMRGAQRGMPRSAMPKDLKAIPALAEAWTTGYNTGADRKNSKPRGQGPTELEGI